jgi:glyoxylase-like metal-dependent hydrolase (beta-lactamase superfamily II)
MSLTERFRVGRFTCHLLDAGRQLLDGGAMFGVVPKPLWVRKIAADQRNRIPLALRCLLIEHDDGLVLVDTGVGNKESEKFIDIYGIDNDGRDGRTRLEDALQEVGHAVGDVRFVVNTHLHFDHCGGNTFVPADARGAAPQLAFPNATYVVQRDELAFGFDTNERTAASYFESNYGPVREAGRWRLVNGEAELLPGIRLVPTPGHTPHHQSVMIREGGDVAFYLADLVPTTAHLPLPWIMGYDLEPIVTLETKRRWLTAAEAEGWTLIFEHDPERGMGRAVKEGKSFGFAPLRA